MIKMEFIEREQKIKDFFNLVYANCKSDGRLVVFALPKQTAHWFGMNEIDKAAKLAAKLTQEHQQVYFNVALQNQEAAKVEYLRRKPDKKEANMNAIRGYETTARELPALFCDIDIAGPGHAQSDLPQTQEEAVRLAYSLGITPTLIILSGGGLHIYWLLKEGWNLDNEVELKKAKKMNSILQRLLMQEAQKWGWKLDFTADLARMLRPDGTFNWKSMQQPVEVEKLEFNAECVYSIETLEAVLIDSEENQRPQIAEIVTNLKKSDFKLLLEECQWMKHALEDADKLSEPEWYAKISIVSRCENGYELAHKVSKPHPHYSYEETQKKVEHALSSAGPRTCGNIEEITGGIYCKDCRHKGNIKSPIVLGYQGNVEIEAVKQTLQVMMQRVDEGDVGAPLEPGAIKALCALEKEDKAEFARIKDRMKNCRVPIAELNRSMKEYREKRKNDITELAISNNDEVTNSLILTSPYPDIYIPGDYIIRESGVFKLVWHDDDCTEQQIAYKPIMISKQLRDIFTNREYLELCWWDNEWTNKTVDRDFIANSKKIIELAAYGFPVHSVNAGELILFLAEMEACNKGRVPLERTTTNLGWQGNRCELGFLLPDEPVICWDTRKDIKFLKCSDGEARVAAAYTEEGSLENWIDAITLVRDYPIVQTLLYTSFAAALVEPLGGSNFVVEAASRTSTGKSTALRAAASVWGNPDEKSSQSNIFTWDVTKVFVERTSSMLNGLPLLLDDTKLAKHTDFISEVVYLYTNGRGKGRGNLKGFAVTKGWKGILISSGEVPLMFLTKNGGIRGRVLELTGKPFGEPTEEKRKLVSRLNFELKNNYAHAGKAFVRYVVENYDKWKDWKEELQRTEEILASKAKTETSGRLAEYAALVSLTGKLVHEALPMKWEYTDPISKLWKSIADQSTDATGEISCLNYVVSWAYSNANQFYCKSADKPSGPCFGRWDMKQNNDWRNIAVLPSILEDIVKKAGYDYEAILSGWKERGWIDTASKSARKYTKQISVDGDNVWAVVIMRDAIENINIVEAEFESPIYSIF